jgi:hypothetical protein
VATDDVKMQSDCSDVTATTGSLKKRFRLTCRYYVVQDILARLSKILQIAEVENFMKQHVCEVQSSNQNFFQSNKNT